MEVSCEQKKSYVCIQYHYVHPWGANKSQNLHRASLMCSNNIRRGLNRAAKHTLKSSRPSSVIVPYCLPPLSHFVQWNIHWFEGIRDKRAHKNCPITTRDFQRVTHFSITHKMDTGGSCSDLQWNLELEGCSMGQRKKPVNSLNLDYSIQFYFTIWLLLVVVWLSIWWWGGYINW